MYSEENQPLIGPTGSQRESYNTYQRPVFNLSSSKMKIFMQVIKNYLSSCCSVDAVKKKIPIMKWLPHYNLDCLQSDFVAGLTVALTVLPQGLAYAKIAGLPPQYGLYSAFIGCFVYCFLGTAKDITLGPTAIMSLLTAAFAASPIDKDPTYAIVLCLFCGFVQLLMGIVHLGALVNFISHPVINAFSSAAAITIGFGQIKNILGLKDISREFLHMVYDTFHKIGETNFWDLGMGAICFVILILLRMLKRIKWKDMGSTPPRHVRVYRYIVWLIGTASNAIVVVGASGVAAIFISQNLDNFSLTGEIVAGLPPVAAPKFSVQEGNTTITSGQVFSDIGAGFIIVPLLGLVELIAIGKAFARQNKYKVDPTQELIAIGIANIVSAFFSSYPITGSFSRTAVNSQSGVRTPASGIFTGVIVLLALQFLTPLFYYIPNAALAAVIIAAVIQMVDYEIIIHLWKTNKLDLLPLFTTFICSLAVGIEYGILIGIGVSLLMLLYPMAKPVILSEDVGVVIIRISQGLKFPAVEHFQDKIVALSTDENGKQRSVVIDCTHITGTDSSSMQAIVELVADIKRKNARIVFACLSDEVLKDIQEADIPDLWISFTVEEGCQLIHDDIEKNLSINSDSGKNEVSITVDGFSSHL